MFLLNFQKDWRLHKSLLIIFFSIVFGLTLVITIFYYLMQNATLNNTTALILKGIWSMVDLLIITATAIMPIILMFFVLKSDLGKNNVHNTVFTPQPLWSWYLPKILFIFIIQGLFAIISLVNTYYMLEIANSIPGATHTVFTVKDHITSFLTTSFNFGFFALLTLIMALFYSFRNRGAVWGLIVAVCLIYLFGNILYTIINPNSATSLTQTTNPQVTANVVVQVKDLIIPFIIKDVIGLFYIGFAFLLFNKKLEY